MSDDVSMGALSGSLGERTKAAITAGCDMVLHCNGKMSEMTAVAAQAPLLAGDCGAPGRDSALAARKPAAPIDIAASRAEFSNLMAGAWTAAWVAARPIQYERFRMNVDEASIQEFEAGCRSAAPTSRRWSSMSRASKARSICC